LSDGYSLDYLTEESVTRHLGNVKDSVTTLYFTGNKVVKKISNGVYITNTDSGFYFEEINGVLNVKPYAKSKFLELFIKKNDNNSISVVDHSAYNFFVVAASNPMEQITKNLSVFAPPQIDTQLLVSLGSPFSSLTNSGDANSAYYLDLPPDQDIFSCSTITSMDTILKFIQGDQKYFGIKIEI
jgi:hypothetical protein